MMLKEYTEAFGVSGCEDEIRQMIKNNVEGMGNVSCDTIGNLIVHKAGKGKKVMLAAHMDEVGFIVTRIKEDGRVMIKPVGGINPGILASKRIILGKNRVPGVIGAKPAHLQDEEERRRPVDIKGLFADIGASNREEAEKYLCIGDYGVFDSSYVDMGRFVKSKALDDRAGCAVITKVLKENYNLDLYGVFTVQEEVGLRGAGPASFSIRPEYAIIIEGTICSDTTAPEKDYVTTCGAGPAVSVIDGTSSGDTGFINRIIDTARLSHIPFQYKRGSEGGNDAGKIQSIREGCITASISIPVRYIHSPVSMLFKEDYINTVKLVNLVLKSLEEDK